MAAVTAAVLPLVTPVPAHVVVIVSGGMDSTVLAYALQQGGSTVTLLSCDYGQRHRRELDYAARTAEALHAPHVVVDLTGIVGVLTGSALTDAQVDVPDGHYTDGSMRATVVPNRNAIMLDVAVARAVSGGADAVAFGAHAGDHPIYPDCRPAFLAAYESTVRLANEGFLPAGFRVVAPFIECSKADIARLGDTIGVRFADTWSCYKGGERHCGTCGTCVERREAFAMAGVTDPTEYATASGVI
ncbi:7-cyano-7-deazaguanine synthase [Micromonospora lupini str. Lupac 08]|uniref:7-cyano-7-deazaguanine synthase n=1 Tax=Micromonospora lupini str. Lupac 08 TaxID=1150864 RepID=I0L1T4_9ACTN|nr:7-cyano-7-deazaguanine synthase [Micromonospora lupini str. Lupac 08]